MAGLFGFAFVIAGATLIFKRVGELAGLVEQFKEALGYKAMEEILSRSKVTAVVATDDMLAFGANRCLTQKNRQEIALVGFNNTLLAEYQKPPLTSVDINAEKIGYYTAKLLVDKLENKTEETFFIIETNLIERESTAKSPRNNEIVR